MNQKHGLIIISIIFAIFFVYSFTKTQEILNEEPGPPTGRFEVLADEAISGYGYRIVSVDEHWYFIAGNNSAEHMWNCPADHRPRMR